MVFSSTTHRLDGYFKKPTLYTQAVVKRIQDRNYYGALWALNKGGDLHYKDLDGNNLLMLTAAYPYQGRDKDEKRGQDKAMSSLEFAQELHKRGLGLSDTNLREQSALSIACQYGNVPIVYWLWNQGVLKDVPDKNRQTPLMLSCYYGKDRDGNDQSEDIVALYLKHFPAAFERQEAKDPPLAIVLAARGKTAALARVSKRQLSSVVRDAKQRTTMWHAAANNHPDTIHMLANNGYRMLLDMPDKDGYTPLMAALRNGHYEASMALLREGALASSESRQGDTPLTLLAPRIYWKATHREGAMGFMLQEPRRGFTDGDFSRAEYRARLNKADLVKALIGADADVDTPCPETLDTPAMTLARQEDFEALQLLVEEGQADLRAQNGDGEDIIAIAKYCNDDRIGEFLKEAKSKRTKDGSKDES